LGRPARTAFGLSGRWNLAVLAAAAAGLVTAAINNWSVDRYLYGQDARSSQFLAMVAAFAAVRFGVSRPVTKLSGALSLLLAFTPSKP